MNFRNALIAAVAVLILAVVGFVFVSRRGGDVPLTPKSPAPPPQAQFQLLEVKAPDASERPEAGARANEQSQKVLTLMNEFYTTAFLRPDQWSAPRSPAAGTPGGSPVRVDLSRFFTAEAAATLGDPANPGSNIGAMGLSDLASRIRRVAPTKAEVQKISFDVEPDLSMPFAIASVTFQARATTAAKSDGPLDIIHTATYWLMIEGDTYKIFGYAVELKADSVTKSAAFGTPSGFGASA